MANWMDDYDSEQEEVQKGQTELDRFFAKREAELAERERQLKEREQEAMNFYQDSQAKQAADAAKFRQMQLEIEPSMRGEDIIRLYKKFGI